MREWSITALLIPHHGYAKSAPRRDTHFSAPASFRASFTADGVSRGLTNSPPDCWLRAAARRPVRPLTTAIQKSVPRRDTPGDAFLYAGGGGRTNVFFYLGDTPIRCSR